MAWKDHDTIRQFSHVLGDVVPLCVLVSQILLLVSNKLSSIDFLRLVFIRYCYKFPLSTVDMDSRNMVVALSNKNQTYKIYSAVFIG